MLCGVNQPVKALSLTQPWASFVAHGLKTIETRSWGTPYRGEMAIHASKGMPGWAREFCEMERVWSLLLGIGISSIDELPRGAIVATCRLHNCFRITEPPLSSRERLLGDFTPGRYAWMLADVYELHPPILAQGHLGLWDWNGEQLPGAVTRCHRPSLEERAWWSKLNDWNRMAEERELEA